MVGSGWLFASYFAVMTAGPLAIGSWVIAALATALVALTYIELGVTRPLAGGNVRWPSMISGPFVGVMIGWVFFLQATIGTPSEASGLLQYVNRWWPGLVVDGSLSSLGLVLAIFVVIAFTVLNWFGVVLMSRINAMVTVFKIGVPLLTVVLLVATGFDSSNFSSAGGVAPYGIPGMLTAVTGAGLIYSFGGINVGAVMAGETRCPRRNLPIGTFVGFAAAFAVYLMLQIAFVGGVPHGVLAQLGWHGLRFDSPFAQVALMLNLHWLAQLLLVDSVVSPAGSLFLGIGTNSRNIFGIAKSRMLPKWVAKVHERSGIPRHALVVNLVVSVFFLLGFQSWQDLVSATGMFFAAGYAIIAVAAGANLKDPALRARPWMRGVRYVAPPTFVISGLIMYWAGWDEVWLALLLFLVSVPLFALMMRKDRKILNISTFRSGVWFLAFMLVLGGISAIGSFGGSGWVGSPWDSVAVAVVSAGFYWWGHRASVAWMVSPQSRAAAGVYC
ncbi:amino acid transporter [Amycolatopsis sp. A1MSW2902]